MVRDLAVSVPLEDVADLLNLPCLDLIKVELVDYFLNRAGESLDAALHFLNTAGRQPETWPQRRLADADPATGGWWLPKERREQCER